MTSPASSRLEIDRGALHLRVTASNVAVSPSCYEPGRADTVTVARCLVPTLASG
jgi:hypothetical protein